MSKFLKSLTSLKGDSKQNMHAMQIVPGIFANSNNIHILRNYGSHSIKLVMLNNIIRI